LKDYAWSASLNVLDALLEQGNGTPQAAVSIPLRDVRYALPAK